MKHNQISLNDYLRKIRLESGLSQGDVASALGYKTPQFISNWERGLSAPPVEILKTLAKMYKVPAEQMYEVFESYNIDLVTKKHHRMFGLA